MTPNENTVISGICFGVVAEFNTPEAILAAACAAYERGYRDMDAYTPFAVEGLAKAIGFRKNRVALCCLLGGLAGGSGGYFMEWFAMAKDYPLNIGGRPFHSIPAFIPITFELTILCAGIATILGMIFLNGLPRPHHPIFSAQNFERATTDKFFLCIEASDPLFDREAVVRFLQTLNPQNISEASR